MWGLNFENNCFVILQFAIGSLMDDYLGKNLFVNKRLLPFLLMTHFPDLVRLGKIKFLLGRVTKSL